MVFETGREEEDLPPKRSAIWAILLGCEYMEVIKKVRRGAPFRPEGAFGVLDGEWLLALGRGCNGLGLYRYMPLFLLHRPYPD